MTVSYKTDPEVYPTQIKNHPAIHTQQGGLILVDEIILDLWKRAVGHSLDSLLFNRQAPFVPDIYLRTALACLAEAGLLTRIESSPQEIEKGYSSSASVSVIIVSHNSRHWLESCIPSILSQTHSRMELIVVDNASIDDTSNWVQQHHSKIKLIQLNQPRSLASALNTGISHSTGFYFLLLNPDTELQQNAVAELLRFAEQSPRCAAVAAKLKLSWAPAFLNGFGNYVGAVTWGTDIGLGHLDLGQFDSVNEVPSACFAAALINKKVYEDVGPFDEEFPLYYEDSEWCYRARIYGYHVLAAPKAVVYHAFGGLTKEVNNEMAARKIGQVVYGRLRFINKILSPRFYVRFTLFYFFEDLFNLLAAFFQHQRDNVRAYFKAYSHYFRSLPELLKVRTQIQSHRKISDKELFAFQHNLPMTLTWHGNPMLTWDLVYHHYLPLIISGKTRSLPEFEGIDLGEIKLKETGNLVNQIKRANQILKVEGFSMLIHRIGRVFQSNFS